MSDVTFNAFKAAFVVYGVSGLIALAIILAAFFLGRYALLKWMDTHFQQRLEAYKAQAQIASENQKHELQKIIEEKKYEINSRFDRTTRINQLEFDRLPDLWAQLNDAMITALGLFGLRQYLNVGSLTEDKFKRHMIEINFTENQIDQIMASPDRAKAYQSIIDSIDYNKATKSFADYASALRKSAIFIRPEIIQPFQEFEEIIKFALVEYDMNRQGFNSPRSFEHSMKLNGASGGKLRDLEKDVRDRLWNSMLAQQPAPSSPSI